MVVTIACWASTHFHEFTFGEVHFEQQRMRGFSLSEIDVEAFHAQPWVLSASDAGIALPEDDPVHPRFYGNFPRKIRRYALERSIISIEDAIRSMTSLPVRRCSDCETEVWFAKDIGRT